MEEQKNRFPGQERRRYRRFRTRIPLKFYIVRYRNVNLAPIKEKAGAGIITNLSLSGFAFVTDLHLPEEMELQADFVLPEICHLQCRGKITRSLKLKQRYTYGVSFAALTAAGRESIAAYIGSRLALEEKIAFYLKNRHSPPITRT